MIRAAVALALAVTSAHSMQAQVAAADVRALPHTSNAIPGYPEILRIRGNSGTLRFRIPIDTNGRVSMSDVRFVHIDDSLFQRAIRNTLPRWRFTPAARGGHLVADTLEYVIEFVAATEAVMSQYPLAIYELSSVASGHYRMRLGWPQQDTLSYPLDSSQQFAVRLAAVREMLAQDSASHSLPSRIVCIGVSSRVSPLARTDSTSADPPLSWLSQLARPRLAAIASRRCPRSYGSHALIRDSAGRILDAPPPGEDPVHLAVGRAQPWSWNTAFVEVAYRKGTIESGYKCKVTARVDPLGEWSATCRYEVMHRRPAR